MTLTAAVVAHAILDREARLDGRQRQIALGAMYGFAAVLGMMAPLVIEPGVVFDLRVPAVGLAALFGGPLAGILASTIAIVYRLYLGGSGAWIGVGGVAVALFLSLAFRFVLLQRGLSARGRHAAAMGILVGSGVSLYGAVTLSAMGIDTGPILLVVSGVATAISIAGLGLVLILQRDGEISAQQLSANRGQLYRLERDFVARGRLIDTLLAAWPDFVFVKDRQSRFIAANEATARVMGAATPRDLIGRSDFDYYPRGHAARHFAEEQLLMATGRPILNQVQNTPDAYEHTTHYSMTKLPMRDGSGNVIGLIGIGRDISHDIETQRKLVAMADEAAEASRAKSAFLGAMSHELRTPLNAVIGYSELLQDEKLSGSADTVRARARDIQSAANHLLRLINDLLDLSQIEAGRVAMEEGPVSLSGLTREAVQMLTEPALDKTVTLDVDDSMDGLPTITGDGMRLRQVLINLVRNAITHTPSGGSVRILGSRGFDGGVQVSVADTGCGIPSDRIGDLLSGLGPVADPKIARPGAGAGIGLPLSRLLVELHDGRLTLTSGPGEGTIASVWLPASRVRQTPLDEPVAVPRTRAGRPVRVSAPSPVRRHPPSAR
ncbi:MAG: ATP-binding protein [Inquilinaceae bacterium]